MGLDVDLFVSPPSDDLLCAICSGALQKPVSCTEGHTFCGDCVSKWIAEKRSCPTCRTAMTATTVSKNRIAENLLGAMVVRCRHYRSQGPDGYGEPPAKRQRADASGACPWQGPLSQLETHLQECGFVPVTCPDACGSQLQRRELPHHKTVCPQRSVLCGSCGSTMPFRALSRHVTTVCPKALVPCPEKCGKKLPREELASHAAADCPATPVDCPYRAQGCMVRPKRGRLQQHVKDGAVQHAQLVLRAYAAVKEEVLGAVEGLTQKNLRLERDVAELKRENALFRDSQGVQKVTVRWTVKNFARKSAAGLPVKSQPFPHANYEFALQMQFRGEASRASIGLFVRHCGGSACGPVRVGGTCLTLQSQTEAQHSVSRTFEGDTVINAQKGIGWPQFVPLSDVHEEALGLCKEDMLHVEAILCVRSGSFQLCTE